MPFFCYNKDDYCDHSEDCDGCNVWVKGKGGKEVPSNGDRIRAMSDEELISFFVLEDKCPKNISSRECDGFESCKDCWVHWLKQPAEEVSEREP